MNNTYLYTMLAQTYGDSSYNSSAYGATGTTTSTGSTGSSSGGGTLSDTGIAIVGIVTLAAIILLVAMAVRIWKRPARKVATQEVEVETSSQLSDK